MFPATNCRNSLTKKEFESEQVRYREVWILPSIAKKRERSAVAETPKHEM